nr:ABC transporter ATP-binding protein [Anaerocolumna cellulosilytica]
MKNIIKYLKPYSFRMTIGFIIKVGGTFMDLGLPWVLAYIIDDVIPLSEVKLILYWGLVMLFLSVGARAMNVIANRMASRVAGDTVERLRHDLFWKIEQLSGAQVDQYTIPSLISRMTSDTYNIHQMVGMMQRLGVRAPIILIGGIIITATLEPVLTLVLIAILPLLAIAVYLVSKKGIPMYSKSQAAADTMIRIVRENISGIRVIKALSKTSHEKRRFSKGNEEVVDREFKAGATMAIINPTMNLLLNVGLTLVVIVGAYRVNSGASEVGKIVAFLSYFTMILNAMLMVTRIFITLSKASASAGRISEVLCAEEDLKLYTEETYPASKEEVNLHIEFKQVSFEYNQTKKTAVPSDSIAVVSDKAGEAESSTCVEDINIKIKPRESLGIIGSTGSGKTTLINLLMRYYDVSEGAIYINSKDIRTIPLNNLRKKFGVVFQNDTIFADTVKGNIDLSRGLPFPQIVQAAEDAQAKEYIEQLGIGDTPVECTEALPIHAVTANPVDFSANKDTISTKDTINNKAIRFEYPVAIKGANLSGGQKQRLLVARALAGKPEILILDDSSSALDYKTDSSLRQAIKRHYSDTTILMVAQRISSIMHMDHILVLEDGKMIGYGTHDQLLESCEVYQEIYQSQMGNA